MEINFAMPCSVTALHTTLLCYNPVQQAGTNLPAVVARRVPAGSYTMRIIHLPYYNRMRVGQARTHPAGRIQAEVSYGRVAGDHCPGRLAHPPGQLTDWRTAPAQGRGP